MKLKLSLVAAMCLIGGCVSASLSSFHTRSSSAAQYYAVPALDWSNMGATDRQRVAAMTRDPLNGPFAANRSERLLDRTSYVFIPVCNGEIRPDKQRLDTVTRGGSTRVEC